MKNSSGPKILVIDHDAESRTMLRLMLREYCVETSRDGTEGLEKLDSFSPDLVILDAALPNIDGYEVCQKIRENPKHQFVKVVFLSSNTEIKDRLKGYHAGGDDYLSKPFYPHELLAKIRVMMRLKTTEEVDQIKQDYLNLLAHETGTPLSVITRWCEHILDDEEMEREEIEASVKKILKSTERLSSNAEKTILAGRLKTNKKAALVTKNAADIASEACDELSDSAEEQRVILEKDLHNTGILANSQLLEKALRFVLENAIGYSPEGGTVLITVTPNEEYCLIRVSDQGKGIDPALMEEIFEMFAAKDISHHKAGLGISLALAKEIISIHKGSITVENAENGGAIFTMQIPLAQ